MRKPLLPLLIIFAVTQTQAQLKKGEKMLGTTFSISHETAEWEDLNEEQKGFQVNIIPQLGFGIGKNWILGIALGYSHSKVTSELSNEEQVLNAFAPGVFVRKFHEFNDKFGIYGQLNLAAGFGKGERKGSANYESDNTILSAMIQPGFYFRPSNKIILEAVFGNIGYTSINTDYNQVLSDSKSNRLQFSISEALGIGFKVVL